MKKEILCLSCRKSDLSKNTIGINKKILGRDIKSFYCMDCLSDYLDISVEELEDKIQEFKDDGCKLFS